MKLNFLTSRMKDFSDIIFLMKNQSIDGSTLQQAIANTFKKRGIVPSSKTVIFSKEFQSDHDKQIQWTAFLRKTGVIDMPPQFAEAVLLINLFLMPVIETIEQNGKFNKKWMSHDRKWK